MKIILRYIICIVIMVSSGCTPEITYDVDPSKLMSIRSTIREMGRSTEHKYLSCQELIDMVGEAEIKIKVSELDKLLQNDNVKKEDYCDNIIENMFREYKHSLPQGVEIDKTNNWRNSEIFMNLTACLYNYSNPWEIVYVGGLFLPIAHKTNECITDYFLIEKNKVLCGGTLDREIDK